MNEPPDRATWVRQLRGANEAQEDALSAVFDERWGRIEETHRAFVERFLALLPPGGRVLDAACGTGKYFGMVLESGRSVLGVDHSGGHLARARDKFPDVPTERRDLQDLPYREEFDGVMCVDAMEMVPPEDWPVVVERFGRAVRPRGWLYLTVERVPEPDLRTATEAARRSGHPVVDREVVWPDDDLYHHYPRMDQVREWLGEAGFTIEADHEDPWDEERFTYRHLLARRRA